MQHRGVHSIFSVLIIFQLLSMLVVPNSSLAAAPATVGVSRSEQQPILSGVVNSPGKAPARDIGINADTTLSVVIVSTPWASLDNKPDTGPRVFVVEAEVTNSGPEPAENVILHLNYNEDPQAGWVLLPGEEPDRTIDLLPVNGVYRVYWFASYPTTLGLGHSYTVTASADNAPPVSTSDNFYGNPGTGMTVRTREVLNTGNSGITNVATDVTVGVAFTVTVTYNLGTNPRNIAFSPAGNLDFTPGFYRLLSSRTRFYNSSGTVQTIADRLYFASVPAAASSAEVMFTFMALAPVNVQICPYAAVGYNSNVKYDQFYCRGNTLIPIRGQLSYTLTKQADKASVQQGEILTYTLHYENSGTLPLSYVWFWDNIDTSIASIVPGSIHPAPDPLETTQSRIAWYLGTVAEAGQPGSSGDLTFSVLIDGAGHDLPDGASLVNHAYSGINMGSLPSTVALTATLTTPVRGPEISITKTDGKTTAQPGESLSYLINIQNQGAVLAAGLVITDVVPADVIFLSATPPPDLQNGQTLVWNSLAPLAPGGGLQINVQGRVAPKAPEGEVLTNSASVQYQNPAGHVFAVKTATDTTSVSAPVLSVSKTASPDPVLVGRDLTYILTYANDGPAPATNVVISDTLPANTSYVSCSGGTSCGLTNDDIVWNLASVGAHSTSTVQFVVRVDSDLQTGTYIENSEYGLQSDQSDFIAGPPVSTLVQRDAAVIQGTAFVDANGNGFFDTGEATLSGVAITLPEANPPTTQPADGSGFYLFRVETQGPATVSAALPAGYERTTPGEVQIVTTLGVTQTINFGYIPANPPFGVVYGVVFDDLNHNGVQETGELGLEGVTVASPGAQVSPLTTSAYGEFTFRYNASGAYPVVETNPAGYLSVTPDSVNVVIDAGAFSSTEVNFADFHGIRVRGQVFVDQNANGMKDSGETGLSGAMIQVGAETQTTGATGEYELYAPAGLQPVDIQETDPAGYVSTTAIPGSGMVVTGVNSLRIASPTPGVVYTGGDFGDVLQAGVVTISGQVWDDNGAGGGELANGDQDGTEPGLPGATVSLSTGLSQMTGSDGSFLLYAPANQAVTITETNPAGYFSTNAVPGGSALKVDNDTLTVSPLGVGSTSAGHAFGDVAANSVALISGRVFDDLNTNGVLDLGETGFPGVAVTLETLDGLENTIQTGPNGGYQFAVLPGMDAILSSAGPADASYHPTTPESVFVRPPTAGLFPDNNFGYSNSDTDAVIYGIVFNDINANGVQDMGEPGMNDIEITLDEENLQLTAQYGLISGMYSYSVDSDGAYTLEETNFYGYRSTTSDLVVVPVLLGDSYNVNFGDTINQEVAAIYGTVFDDLNSNGLQDPGELGLSGVEVTLTQSDGSLVTTITKSYGQYTYGFETSLVGSQMVREQDPAQTGYHSTTPDAINVMVELGQSYIVNFGDTQNGPAVVMGTVFDDQNADGVQQQGEAGLVGVTVELSTGQSTTTGLYGLYRFDVSNPGTVNAVETDPAGYHSTTPNTVVVDVTTIPSVYTVNYGDNNSQIQTSIYGTVFDDINVNGARDPGEPGLPGVTVSLQNEETVTLQTNEWGQYTFWVEEAGQYTIAETDLTNWISTAAIPGSSQVTKVDNNTFLANVETLGADLGENDFGDVLTEESIIISGMVWDDNGAGGGVLADGLRNGAEPGLAGVQVQLSSGLSQLTAADGSFLLYAPGNQQVTLTQTNLYGYSSTGAIPGNGAVRVDNDHIQVGPLAGGSISSGNEFGDVRQADVAVVKTASADSVVAGDLLTYTVAVSNQGPLDATGVIVNDTLPAGVTVETVNPHVGIFDPVTGIWQVGGLQSGAVDYLVFGVKVHPDVTGSIQNLVTVSLAEYDPTLPDNSSSVTTLVVGQADLSITKSDSPDPVEPGGEITYTLNYTNNGLSTATGVTITDILPNEVAFGAVVSQPAGVTGPEIQGQTLVWTAESLAAGESGEIVYTVYVQPDTLGSISNTVTIASLTPDPDEANNTAQESTQVGEPGMAFIYGIVFNDKNGNGVMDAGEAGIPGVTVTLDQETSTLTDAYGNYVLATDTAGVHVVVETDLTGYISTTENEVHLSVELGHSYPVNFGDAFQPIAFSTISGVVYEDTNKNGAWDAGEIGIPGVTVTLQGGATKTTDEYGLYSLEISAAGAYQVAETDLPGYSSTTPNQLSFNVELGQSYTANFGDVMACTCAGDAYEEDDQASSANPIGFGQANAQDHNFCDDSQDWLTFTAQAGGVYTITTSSWGQRADTRLTLYDTDGQTVLAANDDSDGSPDYSSQLVWEAPASGSYYIKVTNRAGLTCCQTDYKIQVAYFQTLRMYLPLVSTSSQPAPMVLPTDFSQDRQISPNGVIDHICPDGFEVDDTQAQAQAIVPGIVQNHSFDSNPNLYTADKDWVWFDARKGDQVSFDLESPLSIQAQMELWDAQGNSLGLVDPSHLDWLVPETGRYYLSVSPLSDQVPFGCTAIAGYNLTMSLIPGNRLFLPFVFKPLE